MNVKAWASAPDISARSVLVTIIGDTLIPIGASVWMAQLLQLTEVFGFSDRLVRTSISRLTADGWLTNERVGRQSRYHLTELALRESAQADERIYEVEAADWTGEWTLLFLNSPGASSADAALIADRLRWNGFVRIGSDLLASPGTKPTAAADFVSLIAPHVRAVTATAAFDDLDRLVEDGFFLDPANSVESSVAYAEFVERYDSALDNVHRLDGRSAFALRTMLVHDLRRIRLRWPDVPQAIRPPEWSGERAAAIAAELYRALTPRAADWLSEVFGDKYPSRIPGRFGSD